MLESKQQENVYNLFVGFQRILYKMKTVMKNEQLLEKRKKKIRSESLLNNETYVNISNIP